MEELTNEECNSLSSMVEMKITEINERIEKIQKGDSQGEREP